MDAKNLLLIALAFFAVFFAFVVGARIRRELAVPGGSVKPSAATLVTGLDVPAVSRTSPGSNTAMSALESGLQHAAITGTEPPRRE
jgi:hypothetical protein